MSCEATEDMENQVVAVNEVDDRKPAAKKKAAPQKAEVMGDMEKTALSVK